MKKLYRSTSNRMVAGVCAGVAEYLNLDPTVIRVLWVIACFGTLGILAYIACAFIIPEKPDGNIVDAE